MIGHTHTHRVALWESLQGCYDDGSDMFEYASRTCVNSVLDTCCSVSVNVSVELLQFAVQCWLVIQFGGLHLFVACVMIVEDITHTSKAVSMVNNMHHPKYHITRCTNWPLCTVCSRSQAIHTYLDVVSGRVLPFSRVMEHNSFGYC